MQEETVMALSKEERILMRVYNKCLSQIGPDDRYALGKAYYELIQSTEIRKEWDSEEFKSVRRSRWFSFMLGMLGENKQLFHGFMSLE